MPTSPQAYFLSPISRLPPELLATIYEICASVEKPFLLHTHEDRPPEQIGWIKVTHVCRRWRQVSLDHAALWSDISVELVPRRLLNEMLQRSSLYPLSLTLRMYRRQGHYMTDLRSLMTAQNFLRLRKLAVYLSAHPPHQQRESFSQLLLYFTEELNLAPILESLTLQYWPRSIRPILFSSGRTPVLRSLHLNGFKPTMDPLIRDRLVHLTLGHPSGMTAMEIYILLGQMPRLETFAAFIIPESTAGASSNGSLDDPGRSFSPRVMLASLTSLSISGSGELCLRLVDSLDMPVCRCIDLTVATADATTFHPFMDPIMNKLGGIAKPPQSLVFIAYPNDTLILNIWAKSPDWSRVWPAANSTHMDYPSENDFGFDPPTCRFELNVHTPADEELDPDDETTPQPLLTRSGAEIWRGLCLSEVTDIGIQHEYDRVWTKVRWLAIFRDALKVRVLMACGTRATLSILNALELPSEERILRGPSVHSDRSLKEFLSPFLQDNEHVTSDDRGSTIEQPDALLFPILNTIVIRHLSPMDTLYMRSMEPNVPAILNTLSLRLEDRRRQGAPPVAMVEIPFFDTDRSKVSRIVERLKTRAGVATVRVQGTHDSEEY